MIIDNSPKSFPDRFLTLDEKKLLLCKLIRYTSTSIANTLPQDKRLEIKLVDSKLAMMLYEHGKESDIDFVLLQIGAYLRNLITNQPESIGLKKHGHTSDKKQ